MASLDTVDPITAEATLNNLTDTSFMPTSDSQDVSGSNYDPNGSFVSSYDGQTPINYDFTSGFSSSIDGIIPPYDPNNLPLTIAPQAISTNNNPAATPNSFFPGALQGIFQSLLSVPAPKPVPTLSGSTVGVKFGVKTNPLSVPLVGNITTGQIMVGLFAVAAIILVSKNA